MALRKPFTLIQGPPGKAGGGGASTCLLYVHRTLGETGDGSMGWFHPQLFKAVPSVFDFISWLIIRMLI